MLAQSLLTPGCADLAEVVMDTCHWCQRGLGTKGHQCCSVMVKWAPQACTLQPCPQGGVGCSTQHKQTTNCSLTEASWALTTALALLGPLDALAVGSLIDNFWRRILMGSRPPECLCGCSTMESLLPTSSPSPAQD